MKDITITLSYTEVKTVLDALNFYHEDINDYLELGDNKKLSQEIDVIYETIHENIIEGNK